MVDKIVTNERRHWYHISSTIEELEVRLYPWDNEQGFNRDEREPNVKRICVAPTIAKCFTAVPYSVGEDYLIYRTKYKVFATKAYGVFDSKITNEHWLLRPTIFIYVGTVKMDVLEKLVGYIPVQAPSKSDVSYSRKVHKWWSKIKFENYLTLME